MITTSSSSLEKGGEVILTLDQSALLAALSIKDVYFQNPQHIKRISAIYTLGEGESSKKIITSFEENLATLKAKDYQSEGNWQLSKILVEDFDNGIISLSRSEIANAEDSDLTIGEVFIYPSFSYAEEGSGAGVNFNDICFVPPMGSYPSGQFIAVGQSGENRLMKSLDGIVWTSEYVAQVLFKGIAEGGGNVSAIGLASPGNQRGIHSEDLDQWYTTGVGLTSEGWQDIAWGVDKFVGINNNASDGTSYVRTSPTGMNWTNRASYAGQWAGITYGGGKFVVIGSNDNKAMTSSDGITWALHEGVPSGYWRGITYGDGLYVAVATFGDNRLMISEDGENWELVSVLFPTNSVAYGNGIFVAVGSSGALASRDGRNWTSIDSVSGGWNAITYGNGKFVAVANSGTTRAMYANY